MIAGTNLSELQTTHLKVLLEPGQDINPVLLNGPRKITLGFLDEE